jgi:calcium-translocating P-type ATPase
MANTRDPEPGTLVVVQQQSRTGRRRPGEPDHLNRGLTQAEAARRLQRDGPNVLARREGSELPRQMLEQLANPLALLLWIAAALSAATEGRTLAVVIVGVILINAVFALFQERQAERAVEALRAYMPATATVIRGGIRTSIPAADLVAGDLMLVEEGGRISADGRLITGAVEVDMSTLTGESMAVERVAGDQPPGLDPLTAPNLIFSGTACTGGEGQAIVLATGMGTQLGRVASLTAGVRRDRSPLERQITRVAWLIALIGCLVSAAFVPIGILAGLDPTQAALFAIGLLVANVPEGLLPTITLALATGARELAHKGALVKRLSAVETLGSASVICTDKTGTLTRNRMRAVEVWTPEGGVPVDPESSRPVDAVTESSMRLLEAAVYCSNANPDGEEGVGDATEVAIALAAAGFGAGPTVDRRAATRGHLYHFDPTLRMMSSVDRMPTGLVLHAKGAPEEVLRRCDGLGDSERAAVHRTVEGYAARGLRVLAVADRRLRATPEDRESAERDLRFLGLVAMMDPPRPEVHAAVEDCHRAGIRIIVITGDHGLTATQVALQVGICRGDPVVVTGEELSRMHDDQLEAVLRDSPEVLFARSSPDAKLRICEALRRQGHVVAMTGDGVNDAPALRRADLGVAMGISGTDVAREAATMVLTDDNFAHIVAAIEEGRRIYDNVRKFILYVFAHATPEIIPFLCFALSGGAIPLPLTVLQILAIDLGTETLPALALGREPAEAGVMHEPPRPAGEGIVQRALLTRAWLVLGLTSAVLAMAGFLFVLVHGGWHPGDRTGNGTPLHELWRQATTMTFIGIVMCQVGAAIAARTQRDASGTPSLRSNLLLLWGIGFELAFAAALVYVPVLSDLFGTSAPPTEALLLALPFPVIVWGVDELRRRAARRAAV